MNSDYVFKIVGCVENQFKDYYNRLQQLIEKLNLKSKVVFTGPINGDNKYSIIANARFMFLVSNSENFGNVVLESLSQGTPVVASKGTPWQSLEESKAGFWIDNNPKEIANCIDRIMSYSEKEYYLKRENAFALAKRFDVYDNINQWETVLKSDFLCI